MLCGTWYSIWLLCFKVWWRTSKCSTHWQGLSADNGCCSFHGVEFWPVGNPPGVCIQPLSLHSTKCTALVKRVRFLSVFLFGFVILLNPLLEFWLTAEPISKKMATTHLCVPYYALTSIAILWRHCYSVMSLACFHGGGMLMSCLQAVVNFQCIWAFFFFVTAMTWVASRFQWGQEI